jgi:hypothetical protein
VVSFTPTWLPHMLTSQEGIGLGAVLPYSCCRENLPRISLPSASRGLIISSSLYWQYPANRRDFNRLDWRCPCIVLCRRPNRHPALTTLPPYYKFTQPKTLSGFLGPTYFLALIRTCNVGTNYQWYTQPWSPHLLTPMQVSAYDRSRLPYWCWRDNLPPLNPPVSSCKSIASSPPYWQFRASC